MMVVIGDGREPDGAVDIFDTIMVLRFVVGLETAGEHEERAADVSEALRARVAEQGRVKVIVELEENVAPEGFLPRREMVRAQRQRVVGVGLDGRDGGSQARRTLARRTPRNTS